MVRFLVQPSVSRLVILWDIYWRNFQIHINLSRLIQQHFAHKYLTCTVIWIYWLAFCLYWHSSLPANHPSDLFFHFLFAALSLVMIQPHLFKSVLEPVLDNLGELSVSRSTDRLTWGIPVSDAINRVHYIGILSTVSDSQRWQSYLCSTIIQPQMGKFIFISFLLLSTTLLW